MSTVPTRRTGRLRMREWRPVDREPFAAMNADPAVMEHFPMLQTREASDASVDRLEAHWAEHGYGLWALERLDTGDFIGFAGLALATFEAVFTPAVEVGWRLAAEHWGQGFATEAGRAALEFGFDPLGLAEIVSFTARANVPSQRVMQRLGLVHEPAIDFEHPKVPVATACGRMCFTGSPGSSGRPGQPTCEPSGLGAQPLVAQPLVAQPRVRRHA